jgi:hypothetical protein
VPLYGNPAFMSHPELVGAKPLAHLRVNIGTAAPTFVAWTPCGLCAASRSTGYRLPLKKLSACYRRGLALTKLNGGG